MQVTKDKNSLIWESRLLRAFDNLAVPYCITPKIGKILPKIGKIYKSPFPLAQIMQALERIYKAYFELKTPRLYYNQLKENTNLSHSSLQNALSKLTKANILSLEKTKSNTYYKIKDKKIFSLKFSEIAIHKFRHLNLGVKSPLRNFLNKVPRTVHTIVIFGSAAESEEKKGSDIDILIVSNEMHNFQRAKKETDALSNYPLSIFECNPSQFVENKDHVIIQAKKRGFPIYKEQNFYEVLLDEY
ncbi:MAG: nucleotidyltransferase domain-containing protein [Candidatus Nanoarchaeia archaeon]